ncbi:SAVED domain-containing protein [Niallia sp. MER 6]|uniref:SAVED domain-containing protein n=1 Tax=Niallia sp. MER 6 TaxID=2939567 RepID=UPI0020422AD6|nr:SAVED domain-containing protein [Niallia sp. MER 6]MCM3029829.1 SAVED domain-containing protein [Niallia sp. MER 6]
MSKTPIPEKVKIRLWGKAAGRCQYEGCNKPLWYDSTTKSEFNSAYIAHIVADSPDGPRGDKQRSELLSKDIKNLMLMCDTHHRLIDRDQVKEHPEELLLGMKKRHEEKMEMLTSLTEEKQSTVLLYGANIGQNGSNVSMEKAVYAMLPEKYPAEKTGMELGFEGSMFNDKEQLYWTMEAENLRRQFKGKVLPRIEAGINHMSIFALAPQPLLIELGRLLSDIQAADVYQLHREPSDWKWQETPEEFDYVVIPPDTKTNTVALNLSLSGTIDNSRIRDVLGNDVSIWTLTIENPYNDFLKSKEQLRSFREVFRKLMDQIKSNHGHKNELHLFPAAPVSIAIEIGRAWMPKADLPLRIYDENNGFSHVWSIE